MVELLNPQKKTSSIGTFIVCLILAILAALFLAFPKYGEYKSDKTAQAQSENSVQTIESQNAAVRATLAKITDSQADLDKLDLAIPDSGGIPDLYALVEQQAKSAGLTLTSMQASDSAKKTSASGNTIGVTDAVSSASGGADQIPSTPAPSATLGIVDLNLQVSGSLDAYSGFLKSLQKTLRIIDVQSIDVSADTEKGTMTFRTVLKTYYQK
jgi:Tfp pilus assembly protein PilO